MKERKFYSLDICPRCGGNLESAGQSKMGNNILRCRGCGAVILEKDIDKIRKDDIKKGKL